MFIRAELSGPDPGRQVPQPGPAQAARIHQPTYHAEKIGGVVIGSYLADVEARVQNSTYEEKEDKHYREFVLHSIVIIIRAS